MTDLQQAIKAELEEAARVLDAFLNDPGQLARMEEIAAVLTHAMKSGGKIISCGNGGSHCDAMHFAEELSGRFRENRQALPAIAISDPSHLSCVGNDYGFDYVFSRFVEGLGRPEDVLLGISTSGKSANIIEAVKAAKAKGMTTVILTGKDGGQLAGMADHCIIVPHHGYADRIQEIHIKIIHILILLIEKSL